MSHIIIGDVHGCFNTLLALINKLPKDIPLIFTGDLVDVGDNSPAVVDYIMQNKHKSVKGNHDDLTVKVLTNQTDYQQNIEDYYFWLDIGGGAKFTIQQIDFLAKLPRVIRLPHHERYNGRYLHISHTFPTEYKNYTNENISDPLWSFDRPQDNMINNEKVFYVLGHKVVEKPVITDFYAMIDTGCGWNGNGYLTALQFPEMKIYQQENIDLKFTM